MVVNSHKKILLMKTFVFGAVASIPFFDPRLNTRYLTSKVCDFAEWQRVIAKYLRFNPNINIASPNDVVAVVCWLRI